METGKKGKSNIIATVILSVVEGFRVIPKEMQVFDSAQTDNLSRSVLLTPFFQRNDLC